MIVFSGLDCSGKSTQIGILADKLKTDKKKVFTFWSRGGYTGGIQILKDLARSFSGKKLPEPGRTQERKQAFQRPVVRKIWLSLAIVDLIFYYGVYLRYKSMIGYTVICDRYLLDTGIDFKLNFPQENTSEWWIWKLLNVLALKPEKTFVSLVPVEVSVVRSKQKYEPFPDSPKVLQERLSLYEQAIQKDKTLVFIDGLQPIDVVSRKINKELSLAFIEPGIAIHEN